MPKPPPRRPGGIPRGLDHHGPALFSYGFRPFFLGGAVWAVLSMALWVAALAGFGTPGGEYGASHWHMHEMLFGFAPAVLCGFLMTAVPNWTGQMPVSGPPLMALAALWLGGRLSFGFPPPAAPLWPAVLLESLFLPLMAALFWREIAAGRKWRDLKLVGLVAVIAAANLWFHALVLTGADPRPAARAAVAGYVVLILIMGGRLVPSFTRNWLARNRPGPVPAPLDGFDRVSVALSVAALALWVAWPETPAAAASCALAAAINLLRLARWRGWRAWPEPMVWGLHLGWLMVPLGFAAVALAAAGGLTQAAALHVFAAGAIGGEMLAVMTRATRSHTGRATEATWPTTLAFLAIAASALLRVAAEFAAWNTLIAAAGVAWIAGFTLYIAEHARMLLAARKPRGR